MPIADCPPLPPCLHYPPPTSDPFFSFFSANQPSYFTLFDLGLFDSSLPTNLSNASRTRLIGPPRLRTSPDVSSRLSLYLSFSLGHRGSGHPGNANTLLRNLYGTNVFYAQIIQTRRVTKPCRNPDRGHLYEGCVTSSGEPEDFIPFQLLTRSIYMQYEEMKWVAINRHDQHGRHGPALPMLPRSSR